MQELFAARPVMETAYLTSLTLHDLFAAPAVKMDLGAWANEEFRVENRPAAGDETLDETTATVGAYPVPPTPYS